MNKEVLSRKINRVASEIRCLEMDMVVLGRLDIAKQHDDYSALSMDIAIKGEYIVRKLRDLVCSYGNAPRAKMLGQAADVQGILVYHADIDNANKCNHHSSDCGGDCCNSDESIVEIVIPSLIPSRNKKPADFIAAPLHVALECFVAGRPHNKPFKRFKNCVISITHVYNKDLFGKGRQRDHDNIELKGIIDTINTFLLTDDNMALCDIFTTHMLSDQDYTLISIVPKDMFLEWYLTRKFERKIPC